MTTSPYPISPASPRTVLLQALAGRSVSPGVTTLVAADPYDLFILGKWRGAVPAYNELVRLSEGAAAAGDHQLEDAATSWLVSLVLDAVVLAQHKRELTRVNTDEGRRRARRLLQDARQEAARDALAALNVEANFSIQDVKGVEDTSGNVAIPFDFPITSETHFRADRALVFGIGGSQSMMPALCVPCLGQDRCPPECPAESGRCGKDFMGVFLKEPERFFGSITGHPGKSHGRLGKPYGVRGGRRSKRPDPIKEAARLMQEIGRPLNRNELRSFGFRGSDIPEAREKLRQKGLRKDLLR